MALNFFKQLFCCGTKEEKVDDEHVIPDETSLLIPQSTDANNSYTDGGYFDNQKLQERLGTIVRAKEGKMVNLGSRIPFNLHNQNLLTSDRTISRSTSGSLDLMARYQSEQHLDEVAQRHHYQQTRYSRSRSHSPHDASSSRSERFTLTVTEQPRPTPVPDVRLVGYTAPALETSRGRTKERKKPFVKSQLGGSSRLSDPEEIPSGKKKLALTFEDDASSIVMSWGD